MTSLGTKSSYPRPPQSLNLSPADSFFLQLAEVLILILQPSNAAALQQSSHAPLEPQQQQPRILLDRLRGLLGSSPETMRSQQTVKLRSPRPLLAMNARHFCQP